MNKKHLVELIKKMAQITTAVPKPAAPAAPAAAPSPTQSHSGNADIIAMQSALIAFASKAANVARNAILKKYGGESAAESFATLSDKIGSSKSGGTPDGNWGRNTNAALVSMIGFTAVLFKIAETFKVEPSYSVASFDALKTFIPKDDTKSLADKIKYASTIKGHIDAASSFLDKIKVDVLDRKGYQRTLSGEEPVVSYKKKEVLSPMEQENVKLWSARRLEKNDVNLDIEQPGNLGVLLKGKINYSDLISAATFDKWLKSSDAKEFVDNGVDKSIIFNAIRDRLNATVGQFQKLDLK